MSKTLGRPIVNAAVKHAKDHISKHTYNGFIQIERVNQINNCAARQRALLELGYMPKFNTVSRLIGYYKP